MKVGDVERTFKTYIPPVLEHQAWSLCKYYRNAGGAIEYQGKAVK